MTPSPSPEAMRAAEAIAEFEFAMFRDKLHADYVSRFAALIDDAFRPRLETLKIDSGNYRGKCAVCMTANCDMLTDGTCVACERDALRESHERLRVACEHCVQDADGMRAWPGVLDEIRLALTLAAQVPR